MLDRISGRAIFKFMRSKTFMVAAFIAVVIFITVAINRKFFEYRTVNPTGGRKFVGEYDNIVKDFKFDNLYFKELHKYAGKDVYNDDGNIIGKTNDRGEVKNRKGRIIGHVDDQGQVWDDLGNLIGTVEKPIITAAERKKTSETETTSTRRKEKKKENQKKDGYEEKKATPDTESAFRPDKQHESKRTSARDGKKDTSGIRKTPDTAHEPRDIIRKDIKQKIQLKIRTAVRYPVNSFYSGDLQAEPEPLDDDIFPPFQLMKCKLVNAVDSSRLQTPAIAILMESVDFGNKCFFPAGSAVRGTMQGTNMRDRIGSRTDWTIIFNNVNDPEMNGKYISFPAIALDMSKDPYDNKWGLDDGLAGIKGVLHNENKYSALKAFTAAALSGAGTGLSMQDMTMTTVGSNQTITSYENDQWKQIAGKSAEKGFEMLSQLILRELSRDVIYVRINPGKTFYLYNLKPVNLSEAKRYK